MRFYHYAKAESGLSDGYNIVGDGANVSFTAGGSFLYRSFLPGHKVAERVSRGEDVWFRLLENDGATAQIEGPIAPSKVPASAKEYAEDDF